MLLRFKKGTVYEGESYGPAYENDVADVKAPYIAMFVAQSRAEPLTAEEADAHGAGARRGSTGLPGSTTREVRAPKPVQCAGTTKRGAPCKASALAGSSFCARHSGG